MDVYKKFGIKKTKSRDMILKELEKIDNPICCEDLYNILSSNNSINLTTVYRNLNTFYKLGIVSKFVNDDNTAYYALANKSHKHYIICNNCQKKIELDSCPINLESIDLHGFKPTSHILEIHGLCEKCAKIIKNDK